MGSNNNLTTKLTTKKSQQFTVRREGLARFKPLRAGRFGTQFYSKKFTHLEVLLDRESNHVSLNVKFFITILSK